MENVDPALRPAENASYNNNAATYQENGALHMGVQHPGAPYMNADNINANQSSQYYGLPEGAHPNYMPMQQSVPHPDDSPYDHSPSQNPDDPNADPKRPRACESCRNLKVKCEPDPNNPEGSCRRCAKARRNCVITQPSRKRQKKTDSRVAELERKIDALTASLHAQGGRPEGQDYQAEQAGAQPYQAQPGPVNEPLFGQGRQSTHNNYPSPASNTPQFQQLGAKRKLSGEYDGGAPANAPHAHAPPTSGENVNLHPSFLRPEKPALDTPDMRHGNNIVFYNYVDAVDRGKLDMNFATQLFECYVNQMAPRHPAVVIPPGMTAMEMRRTKPVLFLAILSVSSGLQEKDLQEDLTKELRKIFAEHIFASGEKSLEIVQALLVCVLWYRPVESRDSLKFYEMVHMAAIMAIDIGMGKRNSGPPNGHPQPTARKTFANPRSIETRRTWLVIYFICSRYVY